MELDSELAGELERAIPHLPTTPASSHLTAGRRARRHRRAFAGVAGAAFLAIVAGGALSGFKDAPPGAEQTKVADSPSASAAAIPDWAEEFGHHGPVSIYPDGRLWVAPDARLIRTIENPLVTDHEQVISSYAVEAETDGEVDWSFVYRVGDSVRGEMGSPGGWTDDFEVWLEEVTAGLEDRPSLGEQLVHFADDGSERLVANPGAVIVGQVDDVVLASMEPFAKMSVAQVTFEGRTWFVLVMDDGEGHGKGPWFKPYEASVVSPSTLDGFLDNLRDRSLSE
jgi:hypothetical protein